MSAVITAADAEALAIRWETEAQEARALPLGDDNRDRRVQAYAFEACARSLRALAGRSGNGGVL